MMEPGADQWVEFWGPPAFLRQQKTLWLTHTISHQGWTPPQFWLPMPDEELFQRVSVNVQWITEMSKWLQNYSRIFRCDQWYIKGIGRWKTRS
jgi:hypothetical protein